MYFQPFLQFQIHILSLFSTLSLNFNPFLHISKHFLSLLKFLDNCTSLLNLPFAARRLFDSKGNEHFSLVNLRRDDLVYVSCGEGWMDPKLSKDQQQRRILLSQLSQDIAKIRQYISLRNPESRHLMKQNLFLLSSI